VAIEILATGATADQETAFQKHTESVLVKNSIVLRTMVIRESNVKAAF
jgi:hypothetical protein